jgi:dihydrofolate reductase
VVTRQRGFHPPGADVAPDPRSAIALARRQPTDEIFVIGGGELYRQMLPLAGRLYLTEVDIEVDGDTTFPAIERSEWREIANEKGMRTEKDGAPSTFRILDRRDPAAALPIGGR